MTELKSTTSLARDAGWTLRRAWIWLALGGAFFAVSTIHHVLPVAAWLAPIFLLRAVRLQRIASLPLVFVVLCGAVTFALRGYLDPSPPLWLNVGIALSYGLIYSLPYAADALITPRLHGLARTLVFPTALTTLDWLLLFHPFPTFGSPAYAQFGNLPLMQLASLTGIWGITFLIGWCAAALNGAWENSWERHALATTMAPFALALAMVLLYGGARLSFALPAGPTAQVAALTPHRELWSYPPVQQIAAASDAERAAFASRSAAVAEDLLARTRQAADAGAQIVVWSETAVWLPEEQVPPLLARAAELARAKKIYLQIGLGSIKRAEQHPFAENRALLFDPQGTQIWDYHKSQLVPVGDAAEMAAGPRQLPSVDTPFGRLATVICYDAAAPTYARQAGQVQAAMLFVPADDWYANRYDHANMHVFRAIENGVALVRPTAKGITYVTDPLGRLLAQSDYFTAAPSGITLVAVPTQAAPTLYTLIGDSFAYGSMLLLAGLAVLALVKRARI